MQFVPSLNWNNPQGIHLEVEWDLDTYVLLFM